MDWDRYLSSDFAAHATSHLLKGAFEVHVSGGVAAHCFSVETGWSEAQAKDPSSWMQTIAQHCNMHSLPLAMSPEASASVVRAAKVQVSPVRCALSSASDLWSLALVHAGARSVQ